MSAFLRDITEFSLVIHFLSNIPNTSYRMCLHIGFLSPVVIVLLWIKPIARDFLANAPMGKTSITL